MKEEKRRIIDKRKKEKFMIDDEYLNRMAKLCGWQGTIVYNSLCRHCNLDQESFPSIKLMSEQHGVGRDTILKGIKNLESRKVIIIKKKRTKDGKWLNNTYILLERSEWNYNSQVGVADTGQVQPSRCGRPDGVGVADTKETHSEGNTYLKETHLLAVANAPADKIESKEKPHSKEINLLIGEFESVNPTYERLFSNITQRTSLVRLLDKFGYEQVKKMINGLSAIFGKPYAPQITTPYQLENKLADYISFLKKENLQNKINVKI